VNVNGQPTRFDQSDTITVNYTVANDQDFELQVEWYEDFQGTELLLGRYNLSQSISADTTINVVETDYTTRGQKGGEFDVDDDDVSNLQERLQNTDPLVGNMPPADESTINIILEPVTAADVGALFALVSTNGMQTRYDQNTPIEQSSTLTSGSRFALSVQWFTTFNGVDLLLGSFLFDNSIDNDQDLTVQSTDYTTTGEDFDQDDDGFSNLQELVDGSDPLDENSPMQGPEITPTNVNINRIDAANAPIIDGLYEDAWDNARFSDVQGNLLNIDNLMIDEGALRPDGQEDGSRSMRWFGMHDDTYLYLFVLGENVATSNPVRDSGLNYYDDDNLNIYIDGNNSKTDTYDGVDDRAILIPLLTDASNLSSNSTSVRAGSRSLPLPALSFFSCLCTSDQHTWEVRIPMAEFGIVVGRPFGLELEIDLDHDGASRDAKWGWIHPSRSNNIDTDEAWRNPSFMGTAVASGA